MNYPNNTENDKKSHEIMEACLRQILEIEGWEVGSLNLPESLKNKPVKSL